MANTKSAQKRTKINAKKNTENRSAKSAVSTAIKKFRTAALAAKLEEAEALFPATVSIIDSAASKGTIHPNNAANKVSSISRLLNDLRAGKIVVAETKKNKKKAAAEAAKAAEAAAAPVAEPVAEVKKPKSAPKKATKTEEAPKA